MNKDARIVQDLRSLLDLLAKHCADAETLGGVATPRRRFRVVGISPSIVSADSGKVVERAEQWRIAGGCAVPI